MFRSFRARLIATVIALIALTAGIVGVVSYILVRDSLRDQLVGDAVARAEFNINTLASVEQLPTDAGLGDFEASGLADRFLLRGTSGIYVEFANGETFTSSLSLIAPDVVLSSDLRRIVEQGDFGYEFMDVDEAATVVVAGRRPSVGPDFFFFDSAEDVENAIDQLARILLITGISVVALGALGAGLIARRVLRPVAVAGDAATAMAGGDLSVRVPAETNDELGSLAIAFNRMATSLEDQIGALVAAHDRERRFVADVSHELRTPLTALVNEAAMLEGRLDVLPAGDRRIGEMLVNDVARLRALVEDLLEVSRLDSGSVPSAPSDVDVERFLAAVIAERHPAARLDVAVPAGSLHTDRVSLERVVGNLLDNAKHHAPGAEATVTVTGEDGFLRIDVADQGPGVAAAEVPRLFDRFYKTDASRQGGSGLGLAIAREHARRLEGDLTARPGEQGGLVFELRIPVTVSLHSGEATEMSLPQAEGEEKDLTRRKP